MKKLFFLLLLTPLAQADMDKICKIYVDFGYIEMIEGYIEQKGCKRNNILQLSLKNISDPKPFLYFISNEWCRFDRNLNIDGATLHCVLYSTKPRRVVEK